MFFSIIIPLFNKEKTIFRAINSVLNQTYRYFELIVVNDGSTDSSFDIVSKIDDPRLIIIDQINRGASAARNEGVRIAKFEWIAFLDADDEFFPKFLEYIVSFITQNNTCSISFVSTNIIYSNTGITAIPNVKTGVYNYFKLCKYDRTPATSSSTVVCREAFIKAGGFPEGVKQFEDWNLWCKLAWVGEFGFIGEPLSYYHISKTGTASTCKRNTKEYYADLIVLPSTIRNWILDGKVQSDLVSDSWKYTNSYIIGQSLGLRRMKARLLMLLFLNEVNLKYLDATILTMFIKAIFLFLLPMGIMDALNWHINRVSAVSRRDQ